MNRYTCENLDVQLKLRVFIGSAIFLLNLVVFIVSCSIYVPRILRNEFMDGGVVFIVLSLALGVVNAFLLWQYFTDLALKEDKFECVVGFISYASSDICIIEKEDGEAVLFSFPKNVYNVMNIYEGKKVRAVRTKKSHLVKEVEVIKK